MGVRKAGGRDGDRIGLGTRELPADILGEVYTWKSSFHLIAKADSNLPSSYSEVKHNSHSPWESPQS